MIWQWIDADGAGRWRVAINDQAVGGRTKTNPQSNVVTVTIIAIDRDLISYIAFSREGNEAGVITAAFVVAGNWDKVGKSSAGIDAQERIAETANGIDGDVTRARSGPFPPG